MGPVCPRSRKALGSTARASLERLQANSPFRGPGCGRLADASVDSRVMAAAFQIFVLSKHAAIDDANPHGRFQRTSRGRCRSLRQIHPRRKRYSALPEQVTTEYCPVEVAS